MKSLELRSAVAWALVAVMSVACLALFVNLQVAFFALVFVALGWWVWRNSEEGFLMFIILAPLLSLFKATQTVGVVTLVKDAIILLLFLKVTLWPLLTKKLPYRRSILFGPAAALVAWTALETLRAGSLSLGILRAREIVLYLLLYFVVLYLPADAKIWRRRLFWFSWSFLIAAFHGGYQWFFAQDSAVLRFDPGRQIWIPRISSTFGHPSVYGEYLVSAAALFASCAMFLQRKWRVLSGVLFIATLPIIFLTYSRAVWIGFAAAMGVVGCVWLWRMLAAKQHSARELDITLPSEQSVPNSRPRSFTQSESRAHFGLRNAPFVKYSLAAFGIVIGAALLGVLLRFTPAGPLLRSAFDPTYKSNEERLEFAARLVAPMSNLDAIIGRGLGDVIQQKLLVTDVGVDEITSADSREIQLAKDSTLVDNQYLKTFVEMGLIGLVIYFWLFWRFAKGSLELLKPSLRNGYGGQIPKAILGIWGIGFLIAFVLQAPFIDVWDVFPTNAMFWIVGGLISLGLTSYTRSNESIS